MNAPTNTTPDIEKPRETYRRLAALANNEGATDAERETARGVMARYIARYGSEVEIPETEPEIARVVEYDGPHENALSTHCALFTGCRAYKIGKVLYEGTKREKFKGDGKSTRIRGPESAVLSAVELYEHHRTVMRRLLTVTENGYRFGAMPLPEATPTVEDKTEREPLTPEMLAALRAASRAGAANGYAKRLGNGGA